MHYTEGSAIKGYIVTDLAHFTQTMDDATAAAAAAAGPANDTAAASRRRPGSREAAP